LFIINFLKPFFMKKTFLISLLAIVMSVAVFNTVEASGFYAVHSSVATALLDDCASSVYEPNGISYPLSDHWYPYYSNGRWTSEHPDAAVAVWNVSGGAVDFRGGGATQEIKFLDEFTTYTVRYYVVDVVGAPGCASVWSSKKTVQTFE
jgi:hypothetical protein